MPSTGTGVVIGSHSVKVVQARKKGGVLRLSRVANLKMDEKWAERPMDAKKEEYIASHLEGSLSVPYDPLFPVDEETITAIRERVGDRTIVVVGDSITAKLLADDLIAQGVEWVQYLEDGRDWLALLGGGEGHHESR